MKCSKCAREQTAMSEDFGIFDYRITATGGNYIREDVKLLGIVRTNLCSSCIQTLHNESTKVDGELKIGRIILLELSFFSLKPQRSTRLLPKERSKHFRLLSRVDFRECPSWILSTILN